MTDYVLTFYLDDITPENAIGSLAFKAQNVQKAADLGHAMRSAIAEKWVADGILLGEVTT